MMNWYFPQQAKTEADHWVDANSRVAEILVRSANDFDLEALAVSL